MLNSMTGYGSADGQLDDVCYSVEIKTVNNRYLKTIIKLPEALAFVEDARLFVKALRSVSKRTVAYAEVPGTQHAFDVFHSVRSAHALNAVSRFLEITHAQRTTQKGTP